MAINVTRENFSFYQKAFTLTDTIKVECRQDLNLSNGKILSYFPSIYLIDTETFDGGVRYTGKVLFNVCYIDLDGKVFSSECATEFNSTVKDERVLSDMTAVINLSVVNVDIPDFTGNISASIAIKASIEIEGENKIDVATGGENLVFKKEEVKFLLPLKTKSAKVPVEDEFELNYPVSDVLIHQENTVVLSATAGVGTIIIDGEAVILAYLLQKNENNDIVKESKIFPFRVEIDYPDVNLGDLCTARLFIDSVKYDVVVDEDTRKSLVRVSLSILAVGKATTHKETSLSTDAFSLTNDLSLKTEEFSLITPQTGSKITSKFNERATLISEPDPGARIMATTAESLEVASFLIKENVLTIDAVLKAKTFYKNTDGQTECFDFTFPCEINETLPNGVENCTITAINVFVTDIGARLISLSEVECFGTVSIALNVEEENKILAINSIIEGDIKPQKTCALSVYLALSGEDLWALSKRLNIPPKEVLSLNPDLVFPLEKNERIVIYRQNNKEY